MSRVLGADGAPLPDAPAVLDRLGVVLSAVPLPGDDVLSMAIASGDPATVAALVDVPGDVLARMPRDVGGPRGVLVVDPGDDDAAALRAGFGTWHVNNAHELHLILEGDGSFWFADDDGVAAEVVLEPGDVIGITGTEHRYEARTPQAFLVRHEEGGLIATDTGRAS
jgi:hypothetical protein